MGMKSLKWEGICTKNLSPHTSSKGGNVTSVGWQVTLCDPIWHVSSCSGEAG